MKVQTNVTVQTILRVNELLAYVDTYIHQASNLKIKMAILKCYADQDVRDAKCMCTMMSTYMSWVIPRKDKSV